MSTQKTSPKKSPLQGRTQEEPLKTMLEQQHTNTPIDKVQDTFPIVGVGASAGGLDAFERLLTPMPTDSGMAFVIIQHLDPTRESLLTELLKKITHMPVIQVVDKMEVQQNCVYVIPPNTDLELRDGTLHLAKPTQPHGFRLPIDIFFRSLAADRAEKAICIILSGTGTDGTLGLKAIKETGGLAIVQAPETTRFDGMPMSAINTELVDMVLAPEKIAEQLINYVKNSFELDTQQVQQFTANINTHLQRILFLLKTHTGHDFSGYKENTVTRRIQRRMTVNQITHVRDYLQFLQETPLEVETLFRELLIGVTNFFRDPQAFEHLEQKVILPLVTEDRDDLRQIRVWIPGCSTGEEAYSVAILLHEQLERSGKSVEIQIFATDIDQTAINKAREGRYPDSIAADVSPERLQRFFNQDEDSNTYQVKRQIREMIVFAEQSMIKDPPFSRLDLICCRNLMIYLGPELQKRLLSLFHYALNVGGYLFLGNSETLGSSQNLFQALDQTWKIFKRAEFVSDFKTVFEFSGQVRGERKSLGIIPDKHPSARELTEQLLLTDYTPTSVLINEKGDMLYIHGHTGKYLEQSTGEASTNILQTAREGLQMPLSTAVRNANAQKKPQTVEGISVKNEAGTIRVKVTVAPVLRPLVSESLMLVTFTEISVPLSSDDKPNPDSINYSQTQHISELEQELKSTREYLQTVIEELETTNEELKSANEELQSANEELHSMNEELQTSKEELQSVNEELVIVNAELQAGMQELTAANNDIKNLLDNIQVGIIFLDMNLRIRRFTPASTGVVDLIAADIGRPMAQFVHKLQYDGLVQDARETLDTLKPKEMEVQNRDGNWYLMRFLPYYAAEQQVDGVVLTMTDITEIKQAEKALADSLNQYQILVEASHDGIVQNDLDGNIISVNSNFAELFGFDSVKEITESGITTFDLLAPVAKDTVMEQAAPIFDSDQIRRVEMKVMKHTGEQFDAEFNTTLIRDDQGNPKTMVTFVRDITERIETERALRESEQRYHQLFAHSLDGVILIQPSGEILYANPAACALLGYSEAELQAGGRGLVVDTEDPRLPDMLEERQRLGRVQGELTLVRHDGTKFEVELSSAIFTLPDGQVQTSMFIRDITERKRAEKALRESEQTYRILVDSIPNTSIHLVDRDLRYLITGGSELANNNFEKSQVEGHTLREAFPKEVADLFEPLFHKALEGEETVFEMPYGSYHYYQQVLPVRDENGRIFAAMHISSNITDRKQKEEVLRQSEAKERAYAQEMETLLDAIPAFVWIAHDPDCQKITGNRAATEFLRTPPDANLSKTAVPDERPRHFTVWKDGKEIPPQQLPVQLAAQGRMIIDYEEEVVFDDGFQHQLIGNASPLYDEEGNVRGAVAAFQDITVLKQAQEALDASQKLLQDIVNYTPALIYMVDTDGHIILANHKLVELLDVSKDEIIGKTRKEVLPEEIALQHQKNDLEVIKTRKAHTFVEENMDDEGKYYYLTTKFPLFNSENEVYAICGISVDITERRRAEEALRESEQRAHALLNAVPDMIFRLNRQGVFLDYKADREDLYAQSTSIIGKRNRDIVPAKFADLIDRQIETTLATKEMQLFEYQLPIPERGVRDYEARMFPSGEDEVTTIVRDVTERKQAEAERKAQELQMVEDQRLKSLGLLAGGVAHDINNLLTPIWMNIDLLQMIHAPTSKAQELLQSIDKAAHKMGDIVHQMLVYAGRRKPEMGELDINRLVNDMYTLLHASLPKNTNLQLELSSDPLPIQGDHTQLEQVLMNLILNASEALEGQTGEIFVSTRQYSDDSGDGDVVILTVRDTGPGIAPEILTRIFDPFFSTKATGRGLGLSAARGIIYAHQGQLEVQSRVGEGTTFTIQLPTAQPNSDSILTSDSTSASITSLQGMWLLIDDEEIVRQSTSEALTTFGLQMIEAPNGKAGLELARKHAAELTGILLDLTMPDMSGREVFQQLRAADPILPVILISGYSEEEVQDLLVQPKVAFVSKPFKLRMLQQIMRDLTQ